MTNHEMIMIWNALNQIKFEKANPKFTYAMSKNKNILRPIVKKIQDLNNPDPKFQQHNQEYSKLFYDYADKDDKGQPKVERGQYVIEERKKEFEKAKKELEDKNKDMIEAENKRREEFEKLMNSEIEEEIKFHKVKLDKCPEEIKIEQMDCLIEYIVIE